MTAGLSPSAARREILGTPPVDGTAAQAYLRDRGPRYLADIDGAGSVNVTDLLAVIGAWGPCQAPPVPCAADLNGDGSVNVSDLLMIIANWG